MILDGPSLGTVKIDSSTGCCWAPGQGHLMRGLLAPGSWLGRVSERQCYADYCTVLYCTVLYCTVLGE